MAVDTARKSKSATRKTVKWPAHHEASLSFSSEKKNNLLTDAISAAASLRPILMTTLTTVFGMLPLAIGLGEGSEMLQPLAFVIVWGLGFSMLVSLVLVPVIYKLLHQGHGRRV